MRVDDYVNCQWRQSTIRLGVRTDDPLLALTLMVLLWLYTAATTQPKMAKDRKMTAQAGAYKKYMVSTLLRFIGTGGCVLLMLQASSFG